MKVKQIRSIEELKVLTFKAPREVVIALEGGGLARKAVSYDSDTDSFWVDDYVTGYQGEYTLDELRSDTNILRAIEAGALYLDDWPICYGVSR